MHNEVPNDGCGNQSSGSQKVRKIVDFLVSGDLERRKSGLDLGGDLLGLLSSCDNTFGDGCFRWLTGLLGLVSDMP